ncbi:acetoacetate decarboxylase [Leucobacter komagatae]|uniref:Acetoacetate decarboxylase n=1 Tax=Leucobacter komagatae TaxID=55969 RepID=A0A542Y517_9MICO|nr:acetoacetate decarboxylase family protein [Leucobacter komagatae]TQL43184.1 acetoacetate decarboxylase [Leucobacter komagatae]
MKTNYDPNSFFDFLGYPSGDTPYTSPDLRTLSVYCRGNRANLEKLLEATPFELTDDRFVVQIADFTNSSVGAFYDSGIVLPVRYGDTVGANYTFEWEDQPWSILLGREVWGYPKQWGKIVLDDAPERVAGEVTREGELQFAISMTPDDSATNAAWEDMHIYPHLQVHYLPKANERGFETFEIVSRDTSKDFKLHSKVFGSAEVELGASVNIGGVALEIVEVLGGEYSVGYYNCSTEHGRSEVIDSLV